MASDNSVETLPSASVLAENTPPYGCHVLASSPSDLAKISTRNVFTKLLSPSPCVVILVTYTAFPNSSSTKALVTASSFGDHECSESTAAFLASSALLEADTSGLIITLISPFSCIILSQSSCGASVITCAVVDVDSVVVPDTSFVVVMTMPVVFSGIDCVEVVDSVLSGVDVTGVLDDDAGVDDVTGDEVVFSTSRIVLLSTTSPVVDFTVFVVVTSMLVPTEVVFSVRGVVFLVTVVVSVTTTGDVSFVDTVDAVDSCVLVVSTPGLLVDTVDAVDSCVLVVSTPELLVDTVDTVDSTTGLEVFVCSLLDVGCTVVVTVSVVVVISTGSVTNDRQLCSSMRMLNGVSPSLIGKILRSPSIGSSSTCSTVPPSLSPLNTLTGDDSSSNTSRIGFQ